jgi:mono/diheme cytochrome c family protein
MTRSLSPTEPQYVPPSVHYLRTVFSLLAWLFAMGVILQVFFAGLGVLVDPAYFGWHTTFAHVLEPLLLGMLLTGPFGRIGWGTFGLTVLLFVLFGLQYVFMYGFEGPARALHVVNALALFHLAVLLGGRSWRLVRGSLQAESSSAAGQAAGKRTLTVGQRVGSVIAVLIGAVLLFGIIFDNGPGFINIGRPASQPPSVQPEPRPAASDGGGEVQSAQLFAQHCAGCHGRNGGGGVGPALAGNARLEDASHVIRSLLEGPGIMSALRDQLSDEELAAVASFVRMSWGNDFGPLSLEDVEVQR